MRRERLSSVDAQPPPAPRPVINSQRWQSLALLHWQVQVDEVRRRLPPGLFVDEFEGRTWLGVVPFVMAGVRMPPLPAVPRWSLFPELNARVYVHDAAGNRGVWFLGLWCSNAGFVASARALGLPYHRTTCRVSTDSEGHVRSYEFARRRSARAGLSFGATVRAAEAVDADSGLNAWLTARWNMFAFRGGRLWRYPVHHEPWRLRDATVHELRTDAHRRLGFASPEVAPLVHVADAVHARVGLPITLPRAR